MKEETTKEFVIKVIIFFVVSLIFVTTSTYLSAKIRETMLQTCKF